MKYYSTNRRSVEVDFKTAVLNGQPPDGGLYMIKNIPKLSKEDILSFKNFNIKQIALKILSSLINDAIPKNNLKEIIDWALNFEISIENIDNNCYVCYLDKGPTASFKDFGARVLAKMMEYFLGSIWSALSILRINGKRRQKNEAIEITKAISVKIRA